MPAVKPRRRLFAGAPVDTRPGWILWGCGVRFHGESFSTGQGWSESAIRLDGTLDPAYDTLSMYGLYIVGTAVNFRGGSALWPHHQVLRRR